MPGPIGSNLGTVGARYMQEARGGRSCFSVCSSCFSAFCRVILRFSLLSHSGGSTYVFLDVSRH